jgi:hypothetical protein
MKRTLTILGLSATLLSPLMARAGADDKAAAQALFDEGRKLVDQGKYAEACGKLESSQRLDPGAGTLLWLATCYDKNGQTASAWVTYTDAATASRTRHPDWSARADERVKALYPTLSHLVIDVPTAPKGLVVQRDGKVVDAGSYGSAVPVDPGHHVVDATAPNSVPFHNEVDVGPNGATQKVTVTLAAAPVAQTDDHPATTVVAQPQTTSSGGGSGMRIAGITTLGVGLAGVVVGGIFGGLAIGQKNAAAPSCTPNFSVCTTAGKASVDDAMTFGTISTIAFIAGGVLAAAGLTVFLLAPKAKESVTVSFSPFGATLGGVF